MNTKSLVLALVVLVLPTGFIFAQEDAKQAQPPAAAQAEAAKPVEVGNKICPVSGDKVPAPGEKGTMGAEPVKYEYNGKIYNLCCPMCVKDFKKDPEKYSAIADKEVNDSKK